jgi:hypothetical protein
VAAPKAGRDAVDATDATDGVMRAAPEQVPKKSLLAKAPKTLKGPNKSHIELESTKRVLAPETLLVSTLIFSPRFPARHLALSGTAQKESFIKSCCRLFWRAMKKSANAARRFGAPLKMMIGRPWKMGKTL